MCPGCRLPLPGHLLVSQALATCPACDRRILVEIFPALLRPAAATAPAETIVEEGVASCFYHPQKKAVVPCQSCGRFLCALCDVDFNGTHLCPTCLESGQSKGKISYLETHRVLWDSASLSLALLPLLIWPFTLVTSPVALGLAIYSFNRPGSLVRRGRARAYLAILLSLVQLAGWVFVFTDGPSWFSSAEH
jgi:hypothetical protein